MSTQAIETTYQKFAYTRKKQTGDVAEFELDGAGSKGRRDGASASSADLAAVVERFLDQIPSGLDGKLSFSDVSRYRQERESQFKDLVRDGLAALGVSDTSGVQLVGDPLTGDVTVLGAGEDKGSVQRYFEAHPEASDELATLVQLGKLADSARYQLGEAGLDIRLAPQAMAAWYRENTSPASWFESGGLSLGDSAGSYRSLDIRV